MGDRFFGVPKRLAIILIPSTIAVGIIGRMVYVSGNTIAPPPPQHAAVTGILCYDKVMRREDAEQKGGDGRSEGSLHFDAPWHVCRTTSRSTRGTRRRCFRSLALPHPLPLLPPCLCSPSSRRDSKAGDVIAAHSHTVALVPVEARGGDRKEESVGRCRGQRQEVRGEDTSDAQCEEEISASRKRVSEAIFSVRGPAWKHLVCACERGDWRGRCGSKS